jgi:hypothetical protein
MKIVLGIMFALVLASCANQDACDESCKDQRAEQKQVMRDLRSH